MASRVMASQAVSTRNTVLIRDPSLPLCQLFTNITGLQAEHVVFERHAACFFVAC